MGAKCGTRGGEMLLTGRGIYRTAVRISIAFLPVECVSCATYNFLIIAVTHVVLQSCIVVGTVLINFSFATELFPTHHPVR